MAAQPKTLAVVTGTRAEYSLLRPVIQKLLKSDDFILKVLATGAHLAPEFGNTVQEIEADGVPIAARIPILKFGTGPLIPSSSSAAGSGSISRTQCWCWATGTKSLRRRRPRP